MSYVLLERHSNRVIWRGSDSYTVDGKPGELPPGIVELRVVQAPEPALAPGQSVERIDSIDVDARTLTHGWRVVEPSADLLAADRVAGERQRLLGEAFVALRGELATTLGIQIMTPEELVGRAEEVLTVARGKRAAADARPDQKEWRREIERHTDLLFRFIVFLSRR